MAAPDPVSWLMIEPGWKVIDRDGDDVGKVEEVLGDTALDIFDGLAVKHGLLSKARYVPAERIAAIYEGEVRLDLSAGEVEQLDERRG